MTLSASAESGSDLSRLHAECEMNYMRLSRLLPEMELGQRFGIRLRVRDGAGPIAAMRVKVLEAARYTDLFLVQIEQAGPNWLPDIELKVRVYHDARMAEVIEWCSDRTIPWALSETPGMQSRDEKWQWNRFLRDLLSHCLTHGLADTDLAVTTG